MGRQREGGRLSHAQCGTGAWATALAGHPHPRSMHAVQSRTSYRATASPPATPALHPPDAQQAPTSARSTTPPARLTFRRRWCAVKRRRHGIPTPPQCSLQASLALFCSCWPLRTGLLWACGRSKRSHPLNSRDLNRRVFTYTYTRSRAASGRQGRAGRQRAGPPPQRRAGHSATHHSAAARRRWLQEHSITSSCDEGATPGFC